MSTSVAWMNFRLITFDMWCCGSYAFTNGFQEMRSLFKNFHIFLCNFVFVFVSVCFSFHKMMFDSFYFFFCPPSSKVRLMLAPILRSHKKITNFLKSYNNNIFCHELERCACFSESFNYLTECMPWCIQIWESVLWPAN